MDDPLTYFQDIPVGDVSSAVTKLVYEAYLKDTDTLEIAIADSIVEVELDVPRLYSFNKELKSLNLANVAARNHCVALHMQRMFAGSSPTWNADKVFKELRMVFLKERQRRDTVSGRYLGLLSSNLDVFKLVFDAIEREDSHRTYVVFSCLGNSFPFLNKLHLQKLIGLLKATYALGSSIAPVFYYQLADHLASRRTAARELYTLARVDLSEALLDLYVVSIEAHARDGDLSEAITLSLKDTESENAVIVRASIMALARLTSFWKTDVKLTGKIQSLFKHMADHRDESIGRQALIALGEAANFQPELLSELVRRAEAKNHHAIKTLAHFVLRNIETLKVRSDLAEILAPLSYIESSDTAELDFILSDLVKDESCCNIVIEWFTQWAINNCETSNSEDKLSWKFTHLLSELFNQNKLYELITKWALSDEKQLGVAFGEAISHLWVHQIKQPIFHKETIDSLCKDDFKYLARRMLGWVFHEDALFSLTFSLLATEHAKERSYPWVFTLLTNEIGTNYPGATLREIETRIQTASSQEKKLLKSIHAELSKYIHALDLLPSLNELRPPEKLQRHIAFKREKQTREGQESAENRSIMRQICREIPLKAGNGCFAIHNNKVGEISRLTRYSYETTLPVGAVIDPVNDTITRIGYRTAKRGDE